MVIYGDYMLNTTPFKTCDSCQRNNYLKSQNNYMYVLNISRFQPLDMLVFIAAICSQA